MNQDATPEQPIYTKIPQDELHAKDGKATQLYMLVCDEGWRTQIICTDMYDWAADWLIETINRQPLPAQHQ